MHHFPQAFHFSADTRKRSFSVCLRFALRSWKGRWRRWEVLCRYEWPDGNVVIKSWWDWSINGVEQFSIRFQLSPPTVIYNKSHAKKKTHQLKPFFLFFLFIWFQYVSLTHIFDSIRFHPLTRFIFVYVIRKKKKEKLYTELVEFPFSLDYTNSNLFNFSLFFSSFFFDPFPFSMISQNTFRTPVYTTSKRRNAMGVGLVFEADLGTTEHVNRWVLQGVCLTLNDDWLTDDVESSFQVSRTSPYDFPVLYFFLHFISSILWNLFWVKMTINSLVFVW